jgi:arylsulfatase A-like enzyme
MPGLVLLMTAMDKNLGNQYSRAGAAIAVLLGVLLCHAGERPNILFAIADDWSYGHAGAYGCKWVKTPAFDRLADQGVLFTRAYTPSAKCAPSRSCILTGRNPWQLKAACNHWCFFPSEFKTFPEALGENGYFVGMTGKGWGPGVATNATGEPRQMAGREFQDRKLTPPAKGIAANDYAANFQDFLKSAPEDQPWFFWYGSHEPHRRFENGAGVSKGGKKPGDIDKVPKYWPDSEVIRNDMLDYAFEVEHFDTHLAKMIEMLEASGRLSNTVIIATSDNGMAFPRVKSYSYENSSHLPLAMMWPAGIRRPARIVDDYVSFIDFAPTILQLAGVTSRQGGMAEMAGKSIVALLASEKSGQIDLRRDHILLGKERFDVGRPNDWGYPIRGIVKNDMLYLKNYEPSRWPAGNPETGYLACDGSPTKTQILEAHRRDSDDQHWKLCFGLHEPVELFDVKKDPECLVNLAGRPETAGLERSLEKRLVKELKKQQDPRMFGKGSVFEAYPYADPKGRDFYKRLMSGESMNASWVNATDFEKRSRKK